jgi:transcriptional regulator with PAS, ATPase and Fis domain
LSATKCDVLVCGASGTGKELVARAIHQASARHHRPFVALNCAAIPKELLESEIFGHAKGAFTGASERRAGKFELAHGGTLFLDEIGELELASQSKLLRVLQEREVTPVGDAQLIKVDVRIIAATNQNLRTLCDEKQFREDLYYRLNVVPIHLPTLAERPGDIPLLVGHIIKSANRRHGRRLAGLDAAAATAMCSYHWPGNVRELHNVIERIAVLKADDGTIHRSDLPSHIAQLSSADMALHAPIALVTDSILSPKLALPQGGFDINEALATMETQLTLDALRRAGGNKARAAALLGLKRTTLVERLKKLERI